ncbi:MAG: GAF domain-containing protein [Polyangiales bacterium]
MNDKRQSRPSVSAAEASPSLRPLAAGIDTVQQLRVTIERFQQESATLLRGASSLEDFLQQQEKRYADLEQELNDTALLYVASYQLNSRREPKEVLRQVRELLEQLAGVEQFALYIAGADGELLLPVAARNLAPSELAPLSPRDRALDAARAGRCAVLSEAEPLGQGSLTQPIAAIPLLLGDRLVGAVLVLKLFEHKTRWAHVDHQLFSLLATHGAPALVAAYLYQRHSSQPAALAGLGESLK